MQIRIPVGTAIALIGPMGAGKSRVGRVLAERLGLPFRDSDDAVEQAVGRSIADIFAQNGEEAFRLMEHRAIAAILDEGPAVIALGGGAVMAEDTRKLVLSRATTIWLRADPEVCAARIGDARTRPLLHGTDVLATLTRLSAERGPIYAQAHLTVDADATPEVVADRMVAALNA